MFKPCCLLNIFTTFILIIIEFVINMITIIKIK